VPDHLAVLVGSGLHYLPPLVLLWLAFFFARTLRAGSMPLIERVARCSKPALSVALCRYTRRLTALWTVYFVIAAVLSLGAGVGYGWVSLTVWSGTVLLFAGERWLRPLWFPGEPFPGLVQQLRDTVSIWRRRP
jgi:uncharacterized membrane protein